MSARLVVLSLAALCCCWRAVLSSTLSDDDELKPARLAKKIRRSVQARVSRADEERKSDTFPSADEFEPLIGRGREALLRKGNGNARDRNLIYKGRPTGGKRYPFLVSMWVNNVRHGKPSLYRYCLVLRSHDSSRPSGRKPDLARTELLSRGNGNE